MRVKKRLIEITDNPGYSLDTEGNVYSQWEGVGKNSRIGKKFKRLIGSVSKSGHITVRLHKKTLSVHRLMYQNFIGEIPKDKLVRHLNDIPGDNRLENLCLGTQSDNMKDCVANGHHKPNRKIEVKQYNKIKKLRETMTVKEIAIQYNVGEKTIRNVINNYYGKRDKK